MSKMVSIIGDSYLQPIAILFEKLFNRDVQVDEVKAGYYENGYSASICVLSALWFESYSIRVRYLNNKHPSAKELSVIKFLMGIYPDFPLEKELTEAFIIRDLIAHNHLWHIDFSIPDINSDDYIPKLLTAEKDEFGGDNKYKNYVDTKSRKTKSLRLNIIPTSINRTDACIVFKIFYDSLLFLEKKNINQCPITISQAIFEGKRYSLQELISEFQKRKC